MQINIPDTPENETLLLQLRVNAMRLKACHPIPPGDAMIVAMELAKALNKDDSPTRGEG